ncbi:putative hydrolase; TatD family protein [Paratrimastix pyriformis]|uniref:Hydrolase n=1 Tax=Paratrimastix pyriformis TaxID=342808 RepID=A0ABQ8UR22_9EUKA|nr:putative hydrolase; TatD family protein [Paratrimastix pyriformis]
MEPASTQIASGPALSAATATPFAKYVDSHTHLDMTFTKFKFTGGWDAWRTNVLRDPNCEKIISVACEPQSLTVHEELARHDDIYVTFGIHPHNAKDYTDAIERQIIEIFGRTPGKAVAWGEMGLDYHYNLSPHDIQKEVFIRQIRRANELHLPFVIHTREAEDDTLAIFREHIPRETKMHVHCFQAVPSTIGFTGVVTYKSAKATQEAARIVPLNRMLLETDAPYMAPIPFRGRDCHSAMIPHTAAEVARLRGCSVEEIFRACRANTTEMYGV